MKKSLIVLSALAFTSLTAVAGGPELMAPPPPPPPCFDGLYIGAGIGAISGNFSNHTFSEAQVFNDDGSVAFDERVGSRYTGGQSNVLGSIFVGYGWVFNQFYAGVELWGSTNSLSNRERGGAVFNNNNENTSLLAFRSTRVRLNSVEGGVDGRLGWLVTPMTMIYGRVGVAFNSIKTTTESIFTSPDAGFQNLDFVTSRNKSVAGLRVGGGIEQCINSDWSLRADYIYTTYGTQTSDTGFLPLSPAPGSAEFNNVRAYSRTNVSTNSVLFSVVYHLNGLV